MRRAIAVGAVLGVSAIAAAAWADSASDVVVNVRGPDGESREGALVVARVKSWPGGKFRLEEFDARTDAKGRVSFSGAIPAGSRGGVFAALVEPGWALASHYDETTRPEPMPEGTLVTRPAYPLRLRFVGDDGQPVKGVSVHPQMRAGPDGVRHSVATGPREAIVSRSGADGVVAMPYFLANDWASVRVEFPGGRWEVRQFRVPAKKPAQVEIPATAPSLPDRDLTAGGDPQKRFFLTGPKPGDPEPEGGYGLVLVLPGGDGSAGFRPWVRQRYDEWVDSGWVWACLVAPKWTPDQGTTWPIAPTNQPGARFTTEEFVPAVIEEASKHVKVNRQKIVALGWSSSGLALYRIASLPSSPVASFLIAMSAFRPNDLESLANAKGRSFFLLHSPEDDRCSLAQAEEARDALKKAGARVEWATYRGGHGWQTDSEDLARRGLRFLSGAK